MHECVHDPTHEHRDQKRSLGVLLHLFLSSLLRQGLSLNLNTPFLFSWGGWPEMPRYPPVSASTPSCRSYKYMHPCLLFFFSLAAIDLNWGCHACMGRTYQWANFPAWAYNSLWLSKSLIYRVFLFCFVFLCLFHTISQWKDPQEISVCSVKSILK